VKTVVDKALKRVRDQQGLNPAPKSRKRTDIEERELLKILEVGQAKIRVIGVGGGGGNTITRMSEIGVSGAETYAINTDAQDLLKAKADRKILIGRKLTRGLGSGSDPMVGESAAQESLEELKELLKQSDLVFITCGMGGGTGTGASPMISEIAKAGHMVCNHTDTHVNYYKLKSAAREAILEKEIKTAEDSIKRAGGIRPLYLRLPNGFSGKWARETVFRLGYSLVNWTYGSDWTQLGREEMLKGYLRNLRPGSILLLHDGGEKEREKTLWLVGRILEDARKKGLKPVRLDELLEPENKN